MARIIGGIAASHTPTIGFALDTHKQQDPVWAPIFEAYKPVQAWLAQKRPEVLVFIYNDHVTSFFLDHYSQFALGVGSEYRPADEVGGSQRDRDHHAERGHEQHEQPDGARRQEKAPQPVRGHYQPGPGVSRPSPSSTPDPTAATLLPWARSRAGR